MVAFGSNAYIMIKSALQGVRQTHLFSEWQECCLGFSRSQALIELLRVWQNQVPVSLMEAFW